MTNSENARNPPPQSRAVRTADPRAPDKATAKLHPREKSATSERDLHLPEILCQTLPTAVDACQWPTEPVVVKWSAREVADDVVSMVRVAVVGVDELTVSVVCFS